MPRDETALPPDDSAKVVLETSAAELAQAQHLLDRLRRDLEVATSDRVLSHTELARALAEAAPRHPMQGAGNIIARLAARAHGVLAWRPQAMPGRKGGRLVIVPETGHRPSLVTDGAAGAPLVSIVVTSFNYGAFVAEAVESALAQTFRDLEVIVVEGGSTDTQSRLAVARLNRPRTRVLMQGRRHLAGANRNFGISQARGRYVCCLDADDTMAPTYVEKAVYLLQRHGYDVVSSALEMFGGKTGRVGVQEKPDLAALLEANQVLTCAVFRRALWAQAGGYRDVDRAVTGYVYEDWAFWVRLAALGARFHNLADDPMLRYRVHGSSLSRGKHVLPEWRQRQLVREMNADVLESLPEAVARSRRVAERASATPLSAPAPLVLDPAAHPGDPPTLLLAMPFLILGGAERLLSAVVGHLVSQGWRVLVITSLTPAPDQGSADAWFEDHTSEIFHLPRFLPPFMWEDFLHHLVASRGVDIVWVAGSAFAYDCLRGLRAAFPALRVADLLFNTVGHVANNRRRQALIDMIFVESQEVKHWLLARGEREERIRLVASGVDLVALRPAARDPALVARISASADDLIVGFSGRWSEEKNPLAFVEIARISNPSAGLRFVMTGTGPMRPAIEQAVAQAGFPQRRFHLLGEVKNIVAAIASYDLLVVPSVLDGRPMVVLEALAMGVPVLASRVGGLPGLVQNGITGWLFHPEDLAGFAARIGEAASDRAGLAAMRLQARAYAEKNLDKAAMFDAYREGLNTLLPEEQALA